MIHGILNLNKPRGWTSHDAVAKVRRIIDQQKVGHAGTLDPNATGVLILCLGKATKLSRHFMQLEKEYHGFFLFGVSTDSQDADGNVVQERDASHINADMVRDALVRYRGEIMQTPPMVSAVKVGGKRLYKLARQGETVERDARPIHVRSFELIQYDHPIAEVNINCSKGTYVRTLAADIGEDLNAGAHLHSLSRSGIGPYKIEDSVTIEQLASAAEDHTLSEKIIPLDSAVQSFAKGVVRGGANRRWADAPLPTSLTALEEIDPLPDKGDFLRIVDRSGRILGVVEVESELGRLRKVYTTGR